MIEKTTQNEDENMETEKPGYNDVARAIALLMITIGIIGLFTLWYLYY